MLATQQRFRKWFYETSWKALELVVSDNIENLEDINFDARDANLNLENANKLLIFIQKAINENKTKRITIFTQQAYALRGESIILSQAMLNGFIKTVMLEHPELLIRQVDLEPNQNIQAISELINAIDTQERILILRNEQWYGMRIGHQDLIDLPEQQESLFQGASYYLITGGLGGIGLELTKYLANNGAKNIILVGRSRPSPHALQVISALEQQGVHIIVESMDVGNKAQVEKLLSVYKDSLQGIFHAAGMLKDATIEVQTIERFKEVFTAKAEGAWNLHEVSLCLNLSLDYFVMFSSIAAINGSAGQVTTP